MLRDGYLIGASILVRAGYRMQGKGPAVLNALKLGASLSA